ncbi:hypothetical protein SMALA_1406 [Streptomyces malaysiensis subsp. malaysiensis]|nr:hypothetical protein SMALA_1406 [Streptomyces malaysiensis]
MLGPQAKGIDAVLSSGGVDV